MEGMKRKKKTDWSLVTFVVIMLALPMFYHILNTYVLGFYNLFFTFQQYDSSGNLVWVGFQNFVTAWNMIFDGSSNLLIGSVQRGLITWVVQNVVCFPFTMIFSLYIAKEYLGNKTFRFFSMLPTMMTGLIMALIFQKVIEGPVPLIIQRIFDTDFIYFLKDPNAFKTLLAYSVWVGFGPTLIIYPNAMNSIEKSIVEASKIDGASDLQQLWHIYMPGIWPTITVMYFNCIGAIISTDVPNFLFFNYSAPAGSYTMGYYLFRQTMIGGEGLGPIINAIHYMLACISVPLTLLWKYVAENYGPSEDEPSKKKRLVDFYANR